MDTYQSPLQILSQQENHQSQVNSHLNSQYHQHHQQVYLIEFQPQHMGAQATQATSLNHHLLHHHHHQPPQQQQQQQQQHHQHYHQHHHDQLQPQLTLMNGSSQQHLVTNGDPLLNGAGSLHAHTPHSYCQQQTAVTTAVSSAANSDLSATNGVTDASGSTQTVLVSDSTNGLPTTPTGPQGASNGAATASASVGALMIDPYSGHAHHAGSAMTLAPTSGSPNEVGTQQQPQVQQQEQQQPQLNGHLPPQQVSNTNGTSLQQQPYQQHQQQAGQQQQHHLYQAHLPLNQMQDNTTNGHLISNNNNTNSSSNNNNNNNLMAPNHNHHNGITMMKNAPTSNFINSNNNNNNQEEYSEIITDYHHQTMQGLHLSHATSQQQLNTSPNQQQPQIHQQIQLHSSPNGTLQHPQHAHLHPQQQHHQHHHHLLQQTQQQPIQLQPQQTNLANLVTTVAHQHQQQQMITHQQLQLQQQQQQHSHLQPQQTIAQTPNTATSTTPNPVRRKRKRCGVCPGCEHKDNCGECGPCKSVRSHQICKMRKCDRLKHKRQATKKQTVVLGQLT